MVNSELINKKLEECRKNYLSIIKELNERKIKVTLNEVILKEPLRINLSAAWNDTPPYCNENSGAILNAAILINGVNPIEVTITKLKEPIIILDSKDQNAQETLNSKKQINTYLESKEKLKLLKVSLIASGLFSFTKEDDWSSVIEKTGGFKISVQTIKIPIGSGLGTSSIIMYAIIKALYKYFGLEIEKEKIYQNVAIAEQLLKTGGGYQDQIGAGEPGIKLIKFKPDGKFCKINIKKVEISENTKKELSKRLLLIYTGFAREAKNTLKKMMGSYIINQNNERDIFKNIGKEAALMKESLEAGDIKTFGKQMVNGYNMNKAICENFSNENIEKLIKILKPNIDGYMLQGAGNGGFLVAILKENVNKQKVKQTLEETNAKIWNMEIQY